MEKLYDLETLPAGVDPAEILQTMTRNTRLMGKNFTIVNDELNRVREENLKLIQALTQALDVIGTYRAAAGIELRNEI